MRFINFTGFIIICFIFLTLCTNISTVSPVTSFPSQTSLPATSTLVLPTQTITPTVTLTSYPTLSSFDAQKKIIELMQTNSNCTTPCFWGIMPEDSELEDAIAPLDLLSKSLNREVFIAKNAYGTEYNYDFHIKENTDDLVFVSLLSQNEDLLNVHAYVGNLSNNEITNQDWLAFRPESVLKTYGVPSQVEFHVSIGPSGEGDIINPTPYSYGFIFYYEQFVVDYSGINVNIAPSRNTYLCPISDYQIERLDIWLGKDLKNARVLKGVNLGKLTTLPLDQFYTLMTGDPNKACINLNFTTLPP